MKVVKTIEVNIPGLGEKIKQARIRDHRPLVQICQELGMSTMNWYRIEKEEQMLPVETLRKIEEVLNVNFKIEI